MASTIHAKDIKIGGDVIIVNGQVSFANGRSIETIPVLYDDTGSYILPVNCWLLSLADSLKDLSSYARAIQHYWSFLEVEKLAWDEFNMPKSHKPTYRWRNAIKKAADSGEIAYSTAAAYVNHVVQFYKWHMYEGTLKITDERFGPFKFESVKIARSDKLAHTTGTILVQTTDLRIKVPKHADSQGKRIRSLNPIKREELKAMIQVLSQESQEMLLMVALGCKSGLRISEVATFPDHLIYKPQSWEKRIELEIGPHVGVKTKRGKCRTIEIPADLMLALYRYSLSERREKRIVNAKGLGKHTPLFITQRRKPYTIKTINKLWGDIRNKIRDRNNIPFNHRFHDCRCSYATYRLQSLLDAGIEPSDALTLLMGWMGHNNEKDTFEYLTFLRTHEVQKEAMTMLDSLMHEALHCDSTDRHE